MMKDKRVRSAIDFLESYLNQQGPASYDPHDLMSTRLGKSARKGYYEKRPLFLPAVAGVYALDLLAPSIRRFFCRPRVSAESLTCFSRGKLDMWRATGEPRYKEELLELLDLLKDQAIDGYSGCCWGLPFDWQMSAHVPAGTPCVTITSAAALLLYEAGLELGDPELCGTAGSAADFILNDLQWSGPLVGYTPLDRVHVVNATALAANVLRIVSGTNGDTRMRELSESMLRRILAEQKPDGSWPYYFTGADHDSRNFIDCFHSCFVIETLMNVNDIEPRPDLTDAIQKGVRFLIDNFLRPDGSCRHYLTYHSPHFIKADARSCAELIRCLALAGSLVDGTLDHALQTAVWSIDNMQLPDGSFRHRIFSFPTPAVSYHRWSNGPMYAALALMNCKLAERMESNVLI